MFVKLALVGVLATTGVVYHHDRQQRQEPRDPRPPARQLLELRDQVAGLNRTVARLERCVEKAQERAASAETRVDELEDMLIRLADRGRRDNCTPSRARLLSYNRARRRNPTRAKAVATAMIREADSNGELNSIAWSLLTDREYSGHYDRLALELTDEMQRRGDLEHNEVDTVALAKFRNGMVREAIELQERAIEMGGDDDEYRDRLRTYRAAQRRALSLTSSATRRVD